MYRLSCPKRPRAHEWDELTDDSDISDYENIIHDFDVDCELISDVESDNEVSSVVPGKWSFFKRHASPVKFLGTPGFIIEMNGKEPIDYFHQIANDDFYKLIIEQTNAYAVNVLAQSKSEKSRISRWKDITVNDLKIWLGLLFHTGTISLGRFNDYWKKDYLFNMGVFSQFMSRDRFLLIFTALHFNCDRHYAPVFENIQPLIDFFNERMDAIYVPHKNLVIDESLVLWRGQLEVRKFIKGNKSRHGMKLYMLRETTGLALKLLPYVGWADEELGGQHHVDKVVRKLMNGRTGIGHSIFMDSFYNSVELVEDLLKDKTLVTGTLRMKRKGNPDAVVMRKLNVGEFVSQYTEMGVCVTKFKDRRDVLMISSEFDSDPKDSTSRLGKMCKKPASVVEYNRNMGKIDYHNEMLSYYPCQRKSLSLFKKLGIHIFQTILLNSHCLYNSQNPKMPLYDFRISVIRSLLGPPPPTMPKKPKKNVHLPSFCEKDKSGSTKRRRCRRCWITAKRRKASLFCCPDCPEKPGFCLEPCFRLYHEEIGCQS